VNRLLWATLVPALSGLIGIEINKHRQRLGLPKQSDFYRTLLSERPVLCADPALAQAPADSPVAVDRIGYLQPQTSEPLPPKLETFLASGPPPVYLGFGSMTDPDPGGTTALIVDAVTRAGCRAIVSAGWAGLGEGPLPEAVYPTGPVDHKRLFPRMAAVVHHGGAGTTTTAARAGVPQIVIPHGVDQYYWAARLHSLGVAPPPLPRGKLSAEVLGDALAATVDNELAASRANDLARQIAVEARELPTPESLLL
jgi:vancomycin aglycone glucosyltransferase